MDRDTWLAARRRGLGSSDAAAVVGLSPWSTPLSVYLEKTGQLPAQEETPAMRWGLALEPAIAAAYQEETGRDLLSPPESISQNREYPWMLATPDRITTCGSRVVELKTASAFAADQWGTPGTDQVPEQYLVQVQHQLAVLRLEVADVAVLIGGQDFRVYTVPRNDSLIDALIMRESDFWQLVLSRTPPEPDWGHATTPGLLDAMYPPGQGWIALDEEDAHHTRVYLEAGAAVKEFEGRKAQAKARLVARMAGAAEGILPDGTRIRRATVQRRGYEVGPTEYTTFTIRPPKEKA